MVASEGEEEERTVSGLKYLLWCGHSGVSILHCCVTNHPELNLHYSRY